MKVMRWQTGLITLAAVGVNIMATPAMGSISVFANQVVVWPGPYYPATWLPGYPDLSVASQLVATNDGVALEIPNGYAVVLAFPGGRGAERRWH